MSPLKMICPGLAALLLAALQDKAPQKLWELDLQSASYGGGAVADLDGDGKPEIVFGTYYNDEHLYAVSAKDGKVLWKHKSNRGPFDASVAIVDLDGDQKPEVLAGDSADGTLFCLDKAGKVLWTVQLPSGTDSPPAVADLESDGSMEIVVGTMMTGDRQGRVCAIRASDRKILWQAKVPGHVQSEPCLVDVNGDGVLDAVVTTWMGDGCVRALSGKDGSEIWNFRTDEAGGKKGEGNMYHGVSAAELAAGQGVSIVFATCGGSVYVLDSKGAVRWKIKMEGEYIFAPTCVADLDGKPGMEVVVPGRSLYVLDSAGKELWRLKGGDRGSERGAAIADVDGDGDLDVVFGAGRTLRALDGTTGAELFSFDARAGDHGFESIGAAPLIADLDGDGALDIFAITGKGTSDESKNKNYGRAYALKCKGRGAGWPTFRGNLKRTGAR